MPEKNSLRLKLVELDDKFPNIPLFQYVHNMVLPTIIITKDEEIVVEVPGYLKGLDILLNRTPKR